MNRHFDSSGRNSWEGFPKSSFGRIDYFEQIDDEEETYFLGLSVIDALSFQEIMTESQTRRGGKGYWEDFWIIRFKDPDTLTADEHRRLVQMEEKFDNLRLFHIVLEGKKRDRSNLVSHIPQFSIASSHEFK